MHLRTTKKIIEASDNFSTVRLIFPGVGADDEEPCIVVQTMVRCNPASHTMARFARLLSSVFAFLKQNNSRFVMWVAPCKHRCIGVAAYDVFMAVGDRRAQAEGSEIVTPENIRVKLQEVMALNVVDLEKCIVPNIVVNLENTDAEGILNKFLEGTLFDDVMHFVFQNSQSTDIKTTYSDSTFDLYKYKSM